MAMTLNRVTLIGHLGQDPKIAGEGERKPAILSLATADRWKDRQSGELKSKTEWHRVAIFNEHLVEVVTKHARKGSKVYVEGSLRTHRWTDQNQIERWTTEVVIGRFDGDVIVLDRTAESGEDEPPAREGDGEVPY